MVRRVALKLGERLGSGDGERKTLLTRQIAFEPLPASVLFGLVWPMVVALMMLVGDAQIPNDLRNGYVRASAAQLMG